MPHLIVLSGMPGVGKSTVGDALVRHHVAVRASIDEVEEAMRACGLPDDATGIAAYEVARAVAEQNLRLGSDVVVDAVNDSEPARETWSRAAAATGAVLVMVVLELRDRELQRHRLQARARALVHVHEPTWTAVEARSKAAAPWTGEVLRLDAALPIDVLARSIIEHLSR